MSGDDNSPTPDANNGSGPGQGGGGAPPDGDYTSEKLDPSSPPEIGKEYDSRELEDGARRTIAYFLISLLWLTTAAILILLSFEKIEIAELKEFAVLLGPIVTLVSAATGFYYGTKYVSNRSK